MLESFNGNALEYKKLSPEEMQSRDILGRLVGVLCETKNKTRNGRFYSKELWDKAINDEIFQEKLKNKCILAELGHPADRTEVDIREACAALAEQPKVGADGMLYGVWDILNTPNGRILKSLCDYGTKIGISSRGEGDIIDDYNGNSSVDPDSYVLETFDMVLLPAVKSARLESVTESLQTTKTLQQALTEELNRASEDDKKIMTETLNKLNIDLNESAKQDNEYKTIEDLFNEKGVEKVFDEDGFFTKEAEDKYEEIAAEYKGGQDAFDKLCAEEHCFKESKDEKFEQEEMPHIRLVIQELSNKLNANGVLTDEEEKLLDAIKKCYNQEDCADKEVNDAEEVHEEPEEVVDDKVKEVLNGLQEALKDKAGLEASIVEVQSKLAVSDVKVQGLTEELLKYKQLSGKLSAKAKQAKELSHKVLSLEESLNKKDAEISKLNESVKVNGSNAKKLNESINARNVKLTKLNEELNSSNEKVKALTEELDNTKQELSKVTENSTKLLTESKEKIEKTTKIAEAYKRMANTTMKKYIESKAVMLGVSFSDIRKRLPESYTVEDVDAICENLQSFNLNISKLPFKVNNTSKIRFTESKNDNLRIENLADEIDDQLLEMAKLG